MNGGRPPDSPDPFIPILLVVVAGFCVFFFATSICKLH